MNPAPAIRGRLAPSPTGYMHLGNAWAFLLAWLAARSAAGQVVLRIEDIDPQRSRPEYAAALIEDLTWLGLDWDFGPDKPEPAANAPLGPFEQSQRGGHYAAAIAEFERDLINERVREGIEAAKKKGIQFGRKAILGNKDKNFIHKQHEKGKSVEWLSKLFHVARNTIYRAIKDVAKKK